VVDPGFTRSTRTDIAGWFRFDSIPDGVFTIEGRDGNNNCVLIDSVVVNSSFVDTLSDTLKASSAATGRIIARHGSSDTFYIAVTGLDAAVQVDSNGNFSLENLPEGNLRLLVFTGQGDRKTVDTATFFVPAGVTVVVQKFAPWHIMIYDGNVDTGRYKAGDTATVLGNTGNLTKDGFAFSGWNTAKDGNGAACQPGGRIVMAAAGDTLFAVWKSLPPASAQCTELAGSAYVPATLGKIICAARDSSGRYYVIDTSGYETRCFISGNDTLFRKRVLGYGVVGERYFTLSLQDTTVMIFENFDGWRDAFVCKPGIRTKYDSLLTSHMKNFSKSRDNDVDSMAAGWREACAYLRSDSLNCRPLSGAAADEIANKPLVNFSPATYVSLVARQAEGRFFLATLPQFDFTPGCEVVHYGMPGSMKKREVVSYATASDGGSTFIKFKVDSLQYQAVFRVQLVVNPDNSGSLKVGPSYFVVNGDTTELERLNPTREIMSQLGFNCPQEMQFWTIPQTAP
jgi:hypothetical protein